MPYFARYYAFISLNAEETPLDAFLTFSQLYTLIRHLEKSKQV